MVDITMFDELDVEKSKWNSKGRFTIFNIAKKKTGTFWPRLLKDTKKDATIKVIMQIPVFQADWDKWIDEDEEEKKTGEEWNPDKMNGIFVSRIFLQTLTQANLKVIRMMKEKARVIQNVDI